ncbi:MAG: flagellar type III secretion system pore protein FliP [Acidobacteria bacterium]|nr:flagellar type III secretion system pore protein FliP [Acidobacteriota bacterium]
MTRRVLVALALLAACAALPALAADDSGPASIQLRLDGGGSTALRLLILMTVLAVTPALLLMMTCFVRFIVALHFLRQALGTPQMPPNQVVIGLALFLTLFTMSPVLEKVHSEAWLPYNEGKLDATAGLTAAAGPMKEFMLRNTREADLALFVRMSKMPRPSGPADLPLRVVVPSYVISELRAGFEIGFLLFLPFLVVDLVVSSILLSMGMMMLPPAMVSLPFKVLLFVLVDGWSLLAGSLVAGVR